MTNAIFAGPLRALPWSQRRPGNRGSKLTGSLRRQYFRSDLHVIHRFPGTSRTWVPFGAGPLWPLYGSSANGPFGLYEPPVLFGAAGSIGFRTIVTRRVSCDRPADREYPIVVESERSLLHQATRHVHHRHMARLKHGIRNSSDKPQFVNFELSTARYRLLPGDELHFFYESEMEGSVAEPLIVDLVESYGIVEIVIWTNFGSEEGPFLPNGDEAMPDYNGI